MDDYFDFTPKGDSVELATKKLRVISEVARERGKVAAFTETGSLFVRDSTWWTGQLYRAMDDDSVHIAYVMLWRNPGPRQFYAPYKGHASAPDFMEFRHKKRMLFQEDFPNVYKSVIMEDLLSRALRQETPGNQR
jgi:mannan endo-1,4-beta-mannosidase